jgi:hypothetical protein
MARAAVIHAGQRKRCPAAVASVNCVRTRRRPAGDPRMQGCLTSASGLSLQGSRSLALAAAWSLSGSRNGDIPGPARALIRQATTLAGARQILAALVTR